MVYFKTLTRSNNFKMSRSYDLKIKTIDSLLRNKNYILFKNSFQCDQIWRFVAILAIFGGLWRQFFCQKLPVHKSFDVDILGFEKFVYVLWRQIWRLLSKCWRLFGLNTWSHWSSFFGQANNPPSEMWNGCEILFFSV